jgi:hypothetical protein
MFLISALFVLCSLGTSAWLIVSGQAESVDGLFLLLTCLLIAFAFALYMVFLIRRAMAELRKPATPAKAAAATKPKAAAPATVEQ